MRIVTIKDPDTGQREVFRFSDFVLVGANGTEGVSEVASNLSERLNRALLASGVAAHCAASGNPFAELGNVMSLSARITNEAVHDD